MAASAPEPQQRELTDKEIRLKLASYGVCNDIPITSSTRGFLLAKISNLEGTTAKKAEVLPDPPPQEVHPKPGGESPSKEVNGVVKDAAFIKKLNPKDSSKVLGVERANDFAEPKVPELNEFRKTIEDSDANAFEERVWKNPRYLVTTSDAPQILKLSTRYNALHCAAKTGSLDVCKRLFSILEGSRYWESLCPKEHVETRKQRQNHLIDLYLNTPDKTLQATPLHFACTQEHEEIVSYLLKFQSLNVQAVNKYGETAYKLAKNNRKIQELIMSPANCYVPVLRSLGNVTAPTLCKPCTEQEMEAKLHHHQRPVLESPVYHSAMAGPMSPQQADSFHKEWRHSPSRKVARSDPDRGWEIIGRQLAHEKGVEWKEKWEFLNCNCDLSQKEGLEALEGYLRPTIAEEGIVMEENEDALLGEFANLSLHDTPQRKKFLIGSLPTKLDYDVLTAISCNSDLSRYPSIVKWKALVESYTEEERKRWRTPSKRAQNHTSKHTPQFEQSPLLYSSPVAMRTRPPPELAMSLFQD